MTMKLSATQPVVHQLNRSCYGLVEFNVLFFCAVIQLLRGEVAEGDGPKRLVRV